MSEGDSRVQRRVFVSGTVQGVNFRRSLEKEVARVSSASRSTVYGFVRNLSDGRVEAVVAGEDHVVMRVAAWCEKGPPDAQVSRIEVHEEPFDSALKEFHIEV